MEAHRRDVCLKVKNMLKHWKILLLSAGLSAYFFGIFANVVADPDLWGYLAFGRLFWEGGHFPYHDVFSYVPTKETWVYHEWLTGVLFFSIYEHFGATGLQLLRYMTIFMTLGMVSITALKRGGNFLSVSVILFLTANAVTDGYSPVRAQIFTYFFFVLSIYILEKFKKDQNPLYLWWLLPVQITWCNLHGGFVAGLGLMGLYAIGEGIAGQKFLPYVRIMILSALVTIINPYGIDYWVYIYQAIGMSRTGIFEWMSIPEAVRIGMYGRASFLFIAILLVSFLLIVRYRKRNLTDILVLTVTGYLGLRHIRHTIFFFLAFGAFMPPVLADFLDGLKHHVQKLDRMPMLKKSLPALLLLLFAVLAGSSLGRFLMYPSFDLRTPPSYYPVGAIEWINAHHRRGNILPHFDWGEFIIWHCYPRCHVAMDGRFETVYGSDVSREYSNFLNGREDWRNFLHTYPHDMVLIKSDTLTAALMRKEPDWKVAYEDKACVLFLRKGERFVPAS